MWMKPRYEQTRKNLDTFVLGRGNYTEKLHKKRGKQAMKVNNILFFFHPEARYFTISGILFKLRTMCKWLVRLIPVARTTVVVDAGRLSG